MKIAVYSVYYGSREPFNPDAMDLARGFDRYVITDRSILPTDAVIINEPAYGLDPKRACSRAKLNPYLYFSDYDWVIYLDNKARLKAKPDKIIAELSSLSDHSFFVFPHDRGCVYKEAITCIKRGLDDPKVIKRQIKVYEEEGFPANQGLIQGTFMVRKMSDHIWEKAGRLWFEQVLHYSRRDQLSFNYIVWRLGLTPYYLSGDINCNTYVEWPVELSYELFKRKYAIVPNSIRRRLKRVLVKTGILGFFRGRSFK